MRRHFVMMALLGFAAACGSDTTGPDGGGDPPPPPPPEEEPLPIALFDRTDEAGFVSTRITAPPPSLENLAIAGGVAAGDLDGDGFIYLVVFAAGTPDRLLYMNDGDGTFTNASLEWGFGESAFFEAGPTFADYDGDGLLDLIIGGVREPADWETHNSVTLMRNVGQGFQDVTVEAGLTLPPELDTYSSSFGDIDGDQDLDLYISHWRIGDGSVELDGSTLAKHLLWRNDGGVFTDITTPAGLAELEYTFNANFTDIDRDGDLDILAVNDFEKSKVMRNDGGVFTEEPNSVLTDGNGMGAAVGDFDKDGDFDWFVSSIWDPNGVAEGNWDITGNRLYRNDGSGGYTEAGLFAGVRQGYWGWGACFADFNNDSHLDIFHVNGMQTGANPILQEFWSDPARLFVNSGNGTFTEMSVEYGPEHYEQGRGVVCFDAERDGDIDIFVANNGTPAHFFRNEGENDNHWLEVILEGPPPNTQGVGAIITVTGNTTGTQIRQIRVGNNYVSQNPAEAHFGLGQDTSVTLTIDWPDGTRTDLGEVAADQVRVEAHPAVAGAG